MWKIKIIRLAALVGLLSLRVDAFQSNEQALDYQEDSLDVMDEEVSEV